MLEKNNNTCYMLLLIRRLLVETFVIHQRKHKHDNILLTSLTHKFKTLIINVDMLTLNPITDWSGSSKLSTREYIIKSILEKWEIIWKLKSKDLVSDNFPKTYFKTTTHKSLAYRNIQRVENHLKTRYSKLKTFVTFHK